MRGAGRSVKLATVMVVLLSMVLVAAMALGGIFLNRQQPVEVAARQLSATPSEPRPPRFLYAIYGTQNTSLQYPLDVTVNGARIYISSRDSHAVMVFDYQGRLIRELTPGAPGGMKTPYGLAIAGSRLYVADSLAGAIHLFDVDDSRYLGRLHLSDPSALAKPADLVIQDGRLYVTDLQLMKVTVWSLEGELLFSFGGEGTASGRFLYPHGIAMGDGEIYVADAGNARIQVFDGEGRYRRTLGGKESKAGGLVTVRGLVFHQGYLYAVLGLSNEVRVLDPRGKLIYAFGQGGIDDGAFSLPNGLFMDANGRLYVTETGNNRVSVFSD